MKKHIIIGKPLSHSLSPEIHNYWFKENQINGFYEKIELKKEEIEECIKKIKIKKIFGMNVTVPYKQLVIPYLETLSQTAEKTNSVNTVYFKNGQIYGDNTDVFGFEQSIIKNKLNLKDKTAFIFGSGGVVPSIIVGLKNLRVKEINISNRTRQKAEIIQKNFNNINVVDWGEIKDCDLFINCTSIGLKKDDKIKIDLKEFKDKKIFYDLIYNPPTTDFLFRAKSAGHKVVNGKDMFLYQAQKAFSLWHDIMPEIDEKLINSLFND